MRAKPWKKLSDIMEGSAKLGKPSREPRKLERENTYPSIVKNRNLRLASQFKDYSQQEP
jgi:hypothetical protein